MAGSDQGESKPCETAYFIIGWLKQEEKKGTNYGRYNGTVHRLAGLVELGKKNKNFLEYAQVDSYFKDMKLNSDMMEAIYDYLEQNGIDVLTLAAVADDDEDLDDPIEDETEIAVPDGVSIEDPVVCI